MTDSTPTPAEPVEQSPDVAQEAEAVDASPASVPESDVEVADEIDESDLESIDGDADGNDTPNGGM